MNEQEKSLKLAELMGWEIIRVMWGGELYCIRDDDSNYFIPRSDYSPPYPVLNPYGEYEEGLAQFAAILLKFPDVTRAFYTLSELGGAYCSRHVPIKPTQANILDEILRMNGVDVNG